MPTPYGTKIKQRKKKSHSIREAVDWISKSRGIKRFVIILLCVSNCQLVGPLKGRSCLIELSKSDFI